MTHDKLTRAQELYDQIAHLTASIASLESTFGAGKDTPVAVVTIEFDRFRSRFSFAPNANLDHPIPTPPDHVTAFVHAHLGYLRSRLVQLNFEFENL